MLLQNPIIFFCSSKPEVPEERKILIKKMTLGIAIIFMIGGFFMTIIGLVVFCLFDENGSATSTQQQVQIDSNLFNEMELFISWKYHYFSTITSNANDFYVGPVAQSVAKGRLPAG